MQYAYVAIATILLVHVVFFKIATLFSTLHLRLNSHVEKHGVKLFVLHSKQNDKLISREHSQESLISEN